MSMACNPSRAWFGAVRWRTCSCGSPAGRWWTDADAESLLVRLREVLAVVPAQLAGHGGVDPVVAGVVPGRDGAGVRVAGAVDRVDRWRALSAVPRARVGRDHGVARGLVRVDVRDHVGVHVAEDVH